MKYDKMITKWNGYIPVVEDTPKQNLLSKKIVSFIVTVRNLGATAKSQEEVAEA
jgi:hypothetical protein